MITVGDIVELLPSNNRNRQLRSQEKKYEWEVLKIDPETICFKGNEGILIKHVGSDHDRWVQREDIKLLHFKENLR